MPSAAWWIPIQDCQVITLAAQTACRLQNWFSSPSLDRLSHFKAPQAPEWVHILCQFNRHPWVCTCRCFDACTSLRSVVYDDGFLQGLVDKRGDERLLSTVKPRIILFELHHLSRTSDWNNQTTHMQGKVKLLLRETLETSTSYSFHEWSHSLSLHLIFSFSSIANHPTFIQHFNMHF